MIRILKGEDNYLYITLRDKTSTNSNTYSFKFVNEVTREEVVVSLSDLSSYKERYSKFFTPSSTFDDNTVGFYVYYVTQQNVVIATGKMELIADDLSTLGVKRYNGYVGSYKTYTT